LANFIVQNSDIFPSKNLTGSNKSKIFMKQLLEFTKRCLLVAAPLLTSYIVASAPSQAAGFASSSGGAEFNNLNQIPQSTGSQTTTDAFVISGDGAAIATAYANALLSVNPPTGFNLSVSQALGTGNNYLAKAQSQTSIIGSFVVDAGQNLTFDFTSFLNLQTQVDNTSSDYAFASGIVSLLLFEDNNPQPLDFFTLASNIVADASTNFIELDNSNNFTINSVINQLPNDINNKSVTVQGSFSSSFSTTTSLYLVEVTNNLTVVQSVPESGNTLGLVCVGIIGVVVKRKYQKISATR
jgi:hypothetical protein